jgi:hypothetical protein
MLIAISWTFFIKLSFFHINGEQKNTFFIIQLLM